MPEALQILGMTVLLGSPAGAAIGMIVWATRGPCRSPWRLLPLLASMALAAIGVVLTVRAPDGMTGLGATVLGGYVLLVGGGATVYCAARLMVCRGRQDRRNADGLDT